MEASLTLTLLFFFKNDNSLFELKILLSKRNIFLCQLDILSLQFFFFILQMFHFLSVGLLGYIELVFSIPAFEKGFGLAALNYFQVFDFLEHLILLFSK